MAPRIGQSGELDAPLPEVSPPGAGSGAHDPDAGTRSPRVPGSLFSEALGALGAAAAEGSISRPVLRKYEVWQQANPGQTHHVVEELPRERKIVGAPGKYWEALRKWAALAARLPTALIEGETGTGKELIARAIHKVSKVSGRSGPFVPLNCAAVPEALLESELLGIESGVATGVSARIGKFESADGGTLLLDEAGAMPPAMQATLLRVVEDGEVVRVGSHEVRHVDALVITATNAVLSERLAQGAFRRDLYNRLAATRRTLQPLSERRDDIPHLVEYFAACEAKRQRWPVTVAREAMERWVERNWSRKNARVLRDQVRSAVVQAHLRGGMEVTAADLPEAEASPATVPVCEEGPAVRLLRLLLRCGGSVERLKDEVLSGRALEGVFTWGQFRRRYNAAWGGRLSLTVGQRLRPSPWEAHSRAAQALGESACERLADKPWPEVVAALRSRSSDAFRHLIS